MVIDTPDFRLPAFDAVSFLDVPTESDLPRGGIPALIKKQNRQNVAKLKQSDDRTIIRVEFENIQAKRTAWSTHCYIGKGAEKLTLHCRLYADNLKQPIEQQLTLKFAITEQSKTLSEWFAAGFTASAAGAPASTGGTEDQ